MLCLIESEANDNEHDNYNKDKDNDIRNNNNNNNNYSTSYAVSNDVCSIVTAVLLYSIFQKLSEV